MSKKKKEKKEEKRRTNSFGDISSSDSKNDTKIDRAFHRD